MLEGTCVHLTACEKKRQKTSSSLLLFLVKAVCEKFAKKAKLLLTWLPIFFVAASKSYLFSLKNLESTSFLWFFRHYFWNYFWILKWQVSSKTEKILSFEFSLVLDTECKSNQCTNIWIDPTSRKKERINCYKCNILSLPFICSSFFLLLQVTKVSHN